MPDTSNVIVLCLDGSEESMHAAQIAMSLVEPDQFRFVLAYVVPDIESAYVVGMDPIAPVVPDPQFMELAEQRRAQAGVMLEDAAGHLGLPAAERVVLSGPPGPALSDYARAEHPALLVTGARGAQDLRSSGVGEVPDYLVRRAPCPVLVVRIDAKVNDAGPVLVCVDGSEHARHAALAVVPLLPAHVPLQLVTVAAHSPTSEPGETGYQMLADRKWEAEEDSVLSDVADALDRSDAIHTVLAGEPVETLLAAAAESSCRAMVIGSKGHGIIARAVLGSVAHKILCEATCPVFVAGPRS